MLHLTRAHYPATYDPVVLAHARALLTSHQSGVTEYIDADLRDTGTILSQAAQVLDFTKPVAVTLIAILHAIPESDDPYRVVATLMDALPSGSYLAISLLGREFFSDETLKEVESTSSRMIEGQFAYRTADQVTRFFDGMDLVEPGLVRVEEWRSEPAADAERSPLWCAVGRKR